MEVPHSAFVFLFRTLDTEGFLFDVVCFFASVSPPQLAGFSRRFIFSSAGFVLFGPFCPQFTLSFFVTS